MPDENDRGEERRAPSEERGTKMHSALMEIVAEDRINEFRGDAGLNRTAKDGRDRERAAKHPRAFGGVLWLRHIATAFGAFVVLALLAPAAFAIPVERDHDTVGTGTLSQLGNPTNIASGASQGYISKVGKESPREPAIPIEGSTPELWLWAGALVALITGAGTVAVWMHRHRRSVATA
jgi:hypothetical protein